MEANKIGNVTEINKNENKRQNELYLTKEPGQPITSDNSKINASLSS